VDAFNLNHDTPLHLAAAMGRRKLTKLLVEAGAMQFRNNQNETPRDIAKRKSLHEILEIIDTQSDKIDKKLIRESLRKSKTSAKGKCVAKMANETIASPYGCQHSHADMSNFPSPKLQTLPKEPLQKGEIYYLDLAGNIKKGIVGMSKCNCAPYSKEAMLEHCKNIQKYVDRANDKLSKKINELSTKIEKTEKRHHNHNQSHNHNHEHSRERSLDPLYPLLKIVGDKNKQIHLEKWLHKVYPEVGSRSDLQSPQSSEIIKQVPVDVHQQDESSTINNNNNISNNNNNINKSIRVFRSNSRKMPQYDEQDMNNQKHEELEVDNDDDSYTDISDDVLNDDDSNENGSASNSENPLYDESFLRKFQQQQFVQHSHPNDSMTSPSVNSNQNIEVEMERITKSLQIKSNNNNNDDEGEMIFSKNPDLINFDHIHVSHSAKRSTKKIKSAITKKSTPVVEISSDNVYVNSFFNHDSSDGNPHKKYDSCDEMENLVTKVQQTLLSTPNYDRNGNDTLWNCVGRSRSRNPLPIDFTNEIENYADNLFRNTPDDVDNNNEIFVQEDDNQNNSTISENNFILLDKLLKARKHLNQNYQVQSGTSNFKSNDIDSNLPSNNIPSAPTSSSLV
jgi:hypothetical protein